MTDKKECNTEEDKDFSIMLEKKINEYYEKIALDLVQSNCCNRDLRVEGETTKYYVCGKCGKARDAK